MNSRANEFRKRNVKQSQAQTEANTDMLTQIQQLIYSMSYKQFETENKLKRLENAARIADYRSLALAKLLENQGISEEVVTGKIMELQAEDFDQNSLVDDSQRNLTVVSDRAAQQGDIVITSIRLFKGDKELTEEKIVRSKIELGKKEIFDGAVDDAVVGLFIGLEKTFDLKIGDKVDRATVTLLGIREAKAPTQAETTPTESSN